MTFLDPLRYRFSVDEFDEMGRVGIFHHVNDRVELIKGEIVQMPPIGSEHASRVSRITQALVPRLLGRAVAWIQSSLRLASDSEPQPDFLLLRPRPDHYASANPSPSAVLLLIEVSDTSIDYDRTVKLPLHATAAIPEVWLVVVPDRSVEIYRDPSPSGHRDVSRRTSGERLAPQAFPDCECAVEELVG